MVLENALKNAISRLEPLHPWPSDVCANLWSNEVYHLFIVQRTMETLSSYHPVIIIQSTNQATNLAILK